MKRVATIINNNQPGWQNIIETEPHVTIDIGTDLYLLDESTGIGQIAKERQEQLDKHGFGTEHDDAGFNLAGELKEAAMFLLSDGACPFPSTWDRDYKVKFYNKSRKEKYVVAAALIAAEIDRLERAGR
jgi:hypothetical protein